MSPHSSFECLAQHNIESLNAEVFHYRHIVTGAEHYHIAADFPENVFLVALRTVPTDSTGVAHVLEHTVLCGSQRYPVRDPFFLMSRRSLNSFMNAFTASDWTAYPFASEHQKDFDNLLDVYLDAVFFANIDERDFHQEGHHLAFDEAGQLTHQGVVYNEMLGAMQPVATQLWEKLSQALFPTSTYHFNSGGEPDQIAQLSYQQVKDFYQAHYHPSNAVFFTFGDRSVVDIQDKIHCQALQHFQRSDKHIEVKPEIRQNAPSHVTSYYATSDEEAGTHVVHGWLLPSLNSAEDFLLAHLLSDLLLDHSASPLRQRLENSPYGLAPSPMCGVEDSMRDALFVYGLEGVKDGDIQAAHDYLVTAMEEIIEQGFSDEQVDAALHQLELMQREISGDGMPFGLQLIMQAMGAAIHRRDVFAMLDVAPALNALREHAKQPGWLASKLRDFTLNNFHKVTLTLKPDLKLGERTDQQRQQQLAQQLAQMSEQDKADIQQAQQALAERQTEVDDVDCLPKMTPEDVTPVAHRLAPTWQENGSDYYHVGSNGISYRYAVKSVPHLDEGQRALVPLYAGILAEVGCGAHDYIAMQTRQASTVGSLGGGIQYRANPENNQQWQQLFSFGGKALARNTSGLEALITDYQLGVRFDEHQRIGEMLTQARLRREQSITNNGHVLAMTAASAAFSPVAAQSHEWSGVNALAALRTLEQQSKSSPQGLTEQLIALHKHMQSGTQQLLLIDDEQGKTSLVSAKNEQPWRDGKTLQLSSKIAYFTDTKVNFCARAFAGSHMTSADAAPLTVLAQVLKNGFLHTAIREKGGAYGGGASYDNGNGVFRFYSYRDPRLTATFDDFTRAIDWVLSADISQEKVNEGILSVISSLDKPLSPAGEAKVAYFNARFGRTYEQQDAFRREILACTAEDLRRVASQYLTNSGQDVVICAADKQPHGFDGLKI
ncbi:insulinase family protein [Salinibius halmophilus]|uniref:insulinase family protein n=1 Tax=Salinibius halmophilus TaxID=1853216 RepID=UPI000E660D64|nr:insulinase family protein [Salinibius halmophilus]